MFNKILKFNFYLLFFSTVCFAEVIKSIEVTGNKRFSNESVIVFSKVDLDIDYDDNKLNEIIKKLYSTNFFKQINLDLKNNVLVIDVIENPIIEDLQINGIKNSKMLEHIEDAMQLKSRKSYVESIFLKDVTLVKNVLYQSGYYFSEVKTSVIRNQDQNSIRLIYDIDTGKKAKISEIVFLGDKKIKDRTLQTIIASEEFRFWKFLSSKTNLNNQRINLDKRLLLNFYKNLGFYNAKINNSFVELKDNDSFKLIFNIDSGKKFTFNKFDLVVPTNYDLKYFKPVNEIFTKLEKKPYSINQIDKLLTAIDKIALSKQYEFINADLTETIIDENKIDITINITESQKFYVQQINVIGNSLTLEEVIRNSLIVDEGDPYNEILFNKSINNLKAKNIFASVKSDIKEGSNENLKIIEINVEEKATGEISLGAGVGTQGGSFGGGIKENNFLGKGVMLDTNLTISKSSVKGLFVYSQPNFNYTDNTLFTSVRSTTTDALKDYGYKTNEVGFSLGTAFEQYENLYFRPEVATSLETLTTDNSATATLKKQEGDYVDLFFNYSLDYDLRNQRYKPSDGYRTVFYQEIPLIQDSTEFVNQFEITKYQSLPSSMIGKVSFYGKAVNSISSKDVRQSKRLYLPANKLRGFQVGKIGPIENSNFIGGNYLSAVNFSTTLPQILPSLENTDISIFIDAANVWGVDYNSSDDTGTIRSAVGLGVDLSTPIGPLSFSLSQPITKKSTDKTQTFRFNLGTTF